MFGLESDAKVQTRVICLFMSAGWLSESDDGVRFLIIR